MTSSRVHRPARPRVRGDLIPPVSDYAHWNEDAERMWFEENRYDMEHWDEPLEDDDDDDRLDAEAEEDAEREELDRGTGPNRYPTILRDANGRPVDVG
jgi:hypothetical protein